jgi:uncharacterized membrane protein
MRRAFGTTASPGASLAIALPLPVLIATFCLLWSSAFSVTKLALADCPPLLLLTARFLVAGVVILGAAAVTGTTWRTVTRRDLIVLAALGVANNALYLGLIYVGMRSISSGLSAIIVSANPVLTALLAAVVLDEQMTWRKQRGSLSGSDELRLSSRAGLPAASTAQSGSCSQPQGWSPSSAAQFCSKYSPQGRFVDRQWPPEPRRRSRAHSVRLCHGERSRRGAKLAPCRGTRLLRLARLYYWLSPVVSLT